MATLQELLMQSCLDRKLPERVAELQLQKAQKSHEEDIEDIRILEKWHILMIQPRMLDKDTHPQDNSCFCGHVLFCARQRAEEIEQQVFRIVEQKESLARAWYQGKHGLTHARFSQSRISRRGNLVPSDESYVMEYGFFSADVEAKVRFQSLAGRRTFEANAHLCLALLRPKLPAKVTEIVKQFIPDYVDHLKQEKERLEKTPAW
mmetsp:Transcript_150425/g.273746  ORF Transcript_150425/g.273746 Transcript_150425/m.273746 type:complete len:205 (+) Transcript_150425:96-710(+)